MSHLFTRAAANNKLKDVKISVSGPSINHLLFEDDALFLCHAYPKSCDTIMKTLKVYEKVSGQVVNLQKSAIAFGSRVKNETKTKLRHI